ncbi:hypothetical protein AAG570_002446 [Ranatra chinensis]|uniref:Hexosyltransferase n=1 Tax=Ranatra chinensis TaxID=642074 RepID=A0ABD0Y7J9_9HEMI
MYLSLLLGLFSSYILSFYVNYSCLTTPFISEQLESFNSIDKGGDDDYEPRINLAGKPQKAKKVPQSLVRPRYYSSELGIRDKLFVSILTTEKTIRNLAVAVNKTSAHLVDKIMYFIDAKSAERANVVNLKLPGIVGFVDDRAILKPFHMLKYLTDNFLEEYDFFFIVKDSTYINSKQLLNMVKKISVSEEVHVGELKSGGGSPFCSLDAGILLSSSVLKKVQSSLDWCVKSSLTKIDDDNVGQCILHASNLPCQNSVQGLTLKSITLPKNIQLETLNDVISDNGVTYHKIFDVNLFYKLHFLITKKALLEIKKSTLELKKVVDIDSGLAWPVGSYPAKVPNTRFDLLRWDYFDETTIYQPSRFSNMRPLAGADLDDAQNTMNTSIQWLIDKYRGEITYQKLVNGYRRFDPSRGLDYIFELSFRERSGKEVIKRVETAKPLGRVELLQVPYVTENLRVSLIMPVHSENKEITVNFMKSYSQICMATSELTFLLLVLLYEPNAPGKGHSADVFKGLKDLALELSSKHRKESSKVAWISIRVPDMKDDFPPLYDDLLYFAIMDLSLKKLLPDSLVLFIEPNTEIRLEYLNRVRMNTIKGTQAFSPIPFTEFDPVVVNAVTDIPRKPGLEIHKNTGHFDIFNTRHISFYKSDYILAREALSAYLPIVKADKDIAKLIKTYNFETNNVAKNQTVNSLFALFGTSKSINLLRAPEPALRLRHAKYDRCKRISGASSRSLLQKQACLQEAAFNTATRSQMASFILNSKNTS